VSADLLDLFGPALFVGAPTRTDPVRPADEDGLHAADQVVLDFEQLAELPGPVDRPVVEKGEGENDAALAVDRDEAAIADAGDGADERRLSCSV
jgi:hypothetical protein